MAHGNLILDRYRPLAEAGTGGFGTVQVAWDQRIQRKVAIKTIQLTELDAFRAALPGAEAVAGSSADASAAEGFDEFALLDDEGNPVLDIDEPVRALAHLPGLDEARTAAMLDDPHIVTVYDFEVRDQTAYLIMEYVEGITLTRFLREFEDYLTLDVVAAVFSSVAGALRTAHSAGVLHLDIKPDNILINAKGEVKVTDFGLATLADAAGLGTTGGGTIGYMPLEQMRREHLDVRCDEWSLAAVLYEMLTGENPFIVGSLDEAEGAILDAELVLPSLCWENLDDQMDDVLFYALDPDREERYATVRDFAEEAMKFLGKPAKGHKQLSAVVTDCLGRSTEDDDEEDTDPSDFAGENAIANTIGAFGDRVAGFTAREHTPLADRVSTGASNVVARLFAAAGSAFVAFLAASNISFFTTATGHATVAAWICALVAAAAGAFRPHIGALVSFVLLGLALVMANSPLPGIVLIAATVAWWYFVARAGIAEANVGLSFPPASALSANAFTPLVAGLALRPALALGATAFAFVCALVFGAFGTGNLIGWDALAHWQFSHVDVEGRFVRMIALPTTWCLGASWLAAAFAESFLGTRGGRASSIIGLVVGTAIMIAGALVTAWLASAQEALAPSPGLILPIVISALVLLAVVIWVIPAYDDEE